MKYNVSKLNSAYNFDIIGPSYVGKPRNNTVMFVPDKVSNLIEKIEGHHECLIFISKGIEIDEDLKKNNLFVECDDPQREYAKFISIFAIERERINQSRHYQLFSEGYYVGG